ncbi:MAG: tetratricopeptide repeat protein [Armatimonadota bacterium]|nr:tetratricopeptide repeat protein [Armatimonadota bacterium]
MAKPSPKVERASRPEWLVQFGRRLRQARGYAGITQEQLAGGDCNKSFISLLESGRSYPSVETVAALARRAGTSVASLLLDPEALRWETAYNLLHLAWHLDPVERGAEALRLAEMAEAVVPGHPAELSARAILVRARIAVMTDRLVEGAQLADQAAAVARRHQLPGALGRALVLRGIAAERRGEYRVAVTVLGKALEIMRQARSAHTEDEVWACLSLGAAWGRTGQLARARRSYRRALELATRLGLQRMRGRALTGLALAEWASRRPDQAVDLLEQAYDAFEQIEDLAEMSRVLNNLGLLRREQGLYAEALAVLQRALRLRDRQPDVRGRSATLDEIAQVYLAMSRWNEAARIARRALKDASASGDQSRQAAAQVTLARALRAQGRWQEAVELLQVAVPTLSRLGMHAQAVSASTELNLLLTSLRAGPVEEHEAHKGA